MFLDKQQLLLDIDDGFDLDEVVARLEALGFEVRYKLVGIRMITGTFSGDPDTLRSVSGVTGVHLNGTMTTQDKP